MTTALGNRAHVVVRPEFRNAVTRCFTGVFGCAEPVDVASTDGRTIVAFRFPAGGSISYEFSADALSDGTLRNGAWLEIRTDNIDELRTRVVAAGLEQLAHPATRTLYVVVPGGQVFGIAGMEMPQP